MAKPKRCYPPPPGHASNVSVGVGGVSSRWAQLLSFHQNTTGTGEGHPEFRIARFHWKGSDDTCPRTKRSDRWFLLGRRGSRLHSAAVDRTLSAMLCCFLFLFPFLSFPSHILISVVSVSTGARGAQQCWILSEVEWSGREPWVLSVELGSSTRITCDSSSPCHCLLSPSQESNDIARSGEN